MLCLTDYMETKGAFNAWEVQQGRVNQIFMLPMYVATGKADNKETKEAYKAFWRCSRARWSMMCAPP